MTAVGRGRGDWDAGRVAWDVGTREVINKQEQFYATVMAMATRTSPEKHVRLKFSNNLQPFSHRLSKTHENIHATRVNSRG